MNTPDYLKTLRSQRSPSEEQMENLREEAQEGVTVVASKSHRREADHDLNFDTEVATRPSDTVGSGHDESQQILSCVRADTESLGSLTEFSSLIHTFRSESNEIFLQMLGKNPELESLSRKKSETAPHEAKMPSSGNCVMLLLPVKQDVSIKEDSGIICLHFASVRGHLRCVDRLLQLGPDPNDSKYSLRDFLHHAETGGRLHSLHFCIIPSINGYEEDPYYDIDFEYENVRGSFHTSLGLSESEVRNFQPDMEYCIRMYAHQSCFSDDGDTVVQMIQGAMLLDILSVNAQDEYGNTLLHEAANKGHSQVVRTLLKCGALSTALNYRNLTPYQLAEQRNHTEIKQIFDSRISSLSELGTVINSRDMDESEMLIQRQLGRCEQYRKLQHLVENSVREEFNFVGGLNCLPAVQKASDLLSIGSPSVPPGRDAPSVLWLAAATNSPNLVHTFLAAGAPLMSSTCNQGLVQISCRDPDNPTPTTFIVAKAARDRLLEEMKFEPREDLEKELIMELKKLTDTLQGKTPWLAKYPKEFGTEKLTQHVLCAASHGATNAVWWLRDAGGSTIIVDSSTGMTALHSALANHRYQTAADLIRYMGANPFLPDASGVLPIDLFPEEQKADIYLGCLAQEKSILYREKKQALKQIETQAAEVLRDLLVLLAVLFVVLYGIESKVRIDITKLYESLELMDDLRAPCPEYGDEVLKLLRLLDRSRCFMEGCHMALEFKNLFERFLLAGLKLCCEKRLPLFMHLLVSVGKVGVNARVNNHLNTIALHHAAACGNMSAVSYLLRHGADLSARDKYGRTPLHYASFYGHNLTFKYLKSHHHDSCGINEKCFFGRTAVDYREAFNTYLRTSGFEEDSSALNYNDEVLLTKYHLEKLKRASKTEGIIVAARKAAVNYEKGEAADVRKAVEESVQELLSAVAAQNPDFEGELKLLGSSAEGARLFTPDEFDFNWVLTKMSGLKGGGLEVRLDSESLQFQSFSVCPVNEKFSKYEDSKVLVAFIESFRKCLINFEFNDSRLSFVPPGVKYKMVGVGLTLMWSGVHYPQLFIDVDIVPTIKAPWPDKLYRAPLVPRDVDVIYLSIGMTNGWRLATGTVEKLVLEGLPGIQKDVFLVCKMLLSALRVPSWVPAEIKNQYRYFLEWKDMKYMRIRAPNGFALKSCFFRELEEMKEKSDWQEDKLMDRIISIFQRMCDPAGSGHFMGEIPPYFGGAVICTEPSGEKIIYGSTTLPLLGVGAPEILEFLESWKESLKTP